MCGRERVHKPLTSLAAEEIASGKPPSQRHGEGNYSFTDPKGTKPGAVSAVPGFVYSRRRTRSQGGRDELHDFHHSEAGRRG
jgi:hypothetical protein